MPVYGPIMRESATSLATYSDEQLETILDFMVRGRDLLARNTTRLIGMIQERDRRKAGDAGQARVGV